ncbi:hypothetical protein Hanom_Chr16g01516301 [Helianthus anomalus]
MEWRGKVWVGRELFSVLSYFDIGVGGLRGSAEIRRLHISWVVFWLIWLPYFFLSFPLSLCCAWCVWFLLIFKFIFELRIRSADAIWGLGFLGLGISHDMGGIRMDQVLVVRHYISFLFFVFSPVGSVFFKNRGVGWVWDSGGIRFVKAFWVVILLKSLHPRSVGFFHSEFCWYFLGNLSLFFFLVACLQGAITIQAASAYIERGLGFLALRRCANLGVIRMESAAAIRTLISAVFIFWILLALGSGSQSWLLWSGWFFLNLFLFSNLSQLWLLVVLGGKYWGSYWETGGIRVLLAFWGALTILVASAFVVWGIGFCVLWDSANLGVIRKGAASVLGHFSPLLLFFCIFFSSIQRQPIMVFMVSVLLLVKRMEGCWLILWVGMNSYSWAWFGLGISGMEWIILAGGNLVDYDMSADRESLNIGRGRWLDGITGINKELGYVDKGWMGRGSLYETWNKFVLLVDA